MAAAPEHRPVTLVSFSGMDGAGKSTQIQNLCDRLRESGLSVRIVTFWDDVARLKGIRETTGHKVFKGDKGVGSPDRPIHRRDKNVRSPWMTAIRLFLYFVDSVSLRRVARSAARSGVDVVIFDRYAYDELANLTLTNPLARAYARFIMSFVPRPHVSFILDADPVKARARKPEYPVEFLHICRQSYLRLSQILGGMTVVEPLSIDEVKQCIVSRVYEAIASNSRNAGYAGNTLDGQIPA